MPRWLASMAEISTKLDYKMIEFFTKLGFRIVELQNMGISLISLKKRAKYWKVCEKGANAHFGLHSTLVDSSIGRLPINP